MLCVLQFKVSDYHVGIFKLSLTMNIRECHLNRLLCYAEIFTVEDSKSHAGYLIICYSEYKNVTTTLKLFKIFFNLHNYIQVIFLR